MFTCPVHGDVDLHSIIETDKWGFHHALTVCPKCGRVTSMQTPIVSDDKEDTDTKGR